MKTAAPLLLAALTLGSGNLAAQPTTSTDTDADTGLRSWNWRHQGLLIKLVQRLPDQTRAFFQGRGFSTDDADLIARSCVFQTIFRNDGQQPVDYDLSDWRVLSSGESLPLQTREAWQPMWQSKQVAQSKQIAFRWSLLPTVQHFEPGDYNWGMTSYGLPPGSTFDLSLQLDIDGEQVSGRIPSVVCATDTSPD